MTFLAFDKPETSFALHQAALQAGTAIGALVTKSLLEVSPASAPVCQSRSFTGHQLNVIFTEHGGSPSP